MGQAVQACARRDAEAFALVGLACGLGARYPRFAAENASQVAGSYGGVAFMILAVLFIIVMIVLLLLLFTVGVVLSGVLPALLAGVEMPPLLPALPTFLRDDIGYFIDVLPMLTTSEAVNAPRVV